MAFVSRAGIVRRRICIVHAFSTMRGRLSRLRDGRRGHYGL